MVQADRTPKASMSRIGAAFRTELTKALRLRFTYVGPVLVTCFVLGAPLMHRIERDNVSDYGFIAFATPAALNLLGLLLILTYCAGLVSSELSSGALRMILIRPLHRFEFLLAKLLFGMSYATTITALVASSSWGTAYLLGELAGVNYGGEIIYTAQEMRNAYFLGALLCLVPQFAAVAYAVMVSACTRSTGAAIGSAVGIWILLDLVKYPLRVAPYLFSTYMEAPWQVFDGRCNAMDSSWFPTTYYCLLTSLISMVLFTSAAAFILHRRNIQA